MERFRAILLQGQLRVQRVVEREGRVIHVVAVAVEDVATFWRIRSLPSRPSNPATSIKEQAPVVPRAPPELGREQKCVGAITRRQRFPVPYCFCS